MSLACDRTLDFMHRCMFAIAEFAVEAIYGLQLCGKYPVVPTAEV